MQIDTTRTIKIVLIAIILTLFSVGVIGAPTVGEEASTDVDGEVIELDHPEEIDADGEFEITVETANSAGTIVEMDPEGFEVDLTSEDAVVIEDNQVEFLDPSAGDSTYTVQVDAEGGEDGNTAAIAVWVNAEDRGDADDEESSIVEIDGDEDEPLFDISIIETNSPVEEGETLDVTADIENEGDSSDTQTVDFDISGLGSDSMSVSLDGSDSQTETFSTPTNDGDAGEYTAEIESDTDDDTMPVSVDAVESPGGGVGGGDDPELSVDIFDLDDSTTIRLADIPRASEADIDTEAAIVGDTFTVSSIWMDFQFSPDDFRIEASDPRADAGGAPSLASDVAEPLGYVELEFIGADESTITDTRIGVQVDDESLSDSESREDLQVYQYIEGDWTPLETELDGETAMATVESITEEQFALGVETSEQTDSEDEQEDQPEETDDEAEDDAGDEADDDTSEEAEEVEDDIPGFGVPIAILALIATTLIMLQRQLTSVFVTS